VVVTFGGGEFLWGGLGSTKEGGGEFVGSDFDVVICLGGGGSDLNFGDRK